MFNRIKNKIVKLFNWFGDTEKEEPKEPLMVRVDVLDHTVSPEKRKEIREQMKKTGSFPMSEIKDEIVSSDYSTNLEQVFNSLPLGGLSDTAKAKIIDIVYLDQLERTKRMLDMSEKYTTTGTKDFDNLMSETDKTLGNE